VSGEGQFEASSGQIPNFDGSVCGTGCEPFVSHVDGDTTNPTSMTTYNLKREREREREKGEEREREGERERIDIYREKRAKKEQSQ
jgi:hypothetical protein